MHDSPSTPDGAQHKAKPGVIHLRLVELLKAHPEGISGGQIRQLLDIPAEEQTHLDRRKRDLRRWFSIRTSRGRDQSGRHVTLYHFEGLLDPSEINNARNLNARIRAQILHAAHGRCQMCGRTIQKHHIVLVVDHKKPRTWGGTDDPDNLWALCEDCNGGKKAYFSSVTTDAELMKRVIKFPSVHVRLGETLKAFGIDRPVPAYLLGIVADQDDWKKRIRDLRYPVIGWDIEAKRYKRKGKTYADYVLRRWQPWPDDPSGVIRNFEESRRRANQLKVRSGSKKT